MFSSSSPHFPLQAPPWAQQLRLPLGLEPHLGHLAAGAALVVMSVAVPMLAVVLVGMLVVLAVVRVLMLVLAVACVLKIVSVVPAISTFAVKRVKIV